MAFTEENGDQTRRKWQSRTAKERRKLSASVEETLAETKRQGRKGKNAVEEISEGDAQRDSLVISPRISLQSRPLPAVHSDELPGSTRAIVPANAMIEPRSSDMQNTSVLRRIAQRISASFAAFGSIIQPDSLPNLPPPSRDEYQELSRMRDSSLLPPVIEVETNLVAGMADTPPRTRVVSERPPENAVVDALTHPPMTRVVGERPSDSSVVEAMPPPRKTTHVPVTPEPPPDTPSDKPLAKMVKSLTGSKSPKTSRKRLAGHTTKIHLENADTGAQAAVEVRKDSAVNGRGQEVVKHTDKLANGVLVKEEVMDVHHSVARATRSGLSGSAVFEVGQSEVTVRNQQVTAASVVQVMLTQNPGPVVLHYVSLLPQQSFTVHLTAPATLRASFNYIILQGELF